MRVNVVAADSSESARGNNTTVIEPEFIRPSEAYALYRVKRGFLYSLIKQGKVRSIALRQRGSVKGIRLIVHQSLRDYVLAREVVMGSESEIEASPEKMEVPNG